MPGQIILRLIAKVSVKILSTPGHGALVNERLDVMGLKVTKIHFSIAVDITVRDEARVIGQHITPLRLSGLAAGGPHSLRSVGVNDSVAAGLSFVVSGVKDGASARTAGSATI
jgi:hypothetical protein